MRSFAIVSFLLLFGLVGYFVTTQNDASYEPDDSEWSEVKTSNDADRIARFLGTYPNSNHRDEAAALLTTLVLGEEVTRGFQSDLMGFPDTDATVLETARQTSSERPID